MRSLEINGTAPRPASSQMDKVPGGQWRTVLADATKSDSGGCVAHRVHRNRQFHVPGTTIALEPLGRFHLPHSCGVFYFYEINKHAFSLKKADKGVNLHK